MADIKTIHGEPIADIASILGEPDIDTILGADIPADGIVVEWDASTTWDNVPVSGHRGFLITGMVSGDVITIYYKVYYYPEGLEGTESANGRIRENGSSWQTEASFSGSNPSTSNESHSGIDYNDNVEVQGNASAGHPEDFCSIGFEITSVTVTAGGKSAVVGARDYWEDVNSGFAP